VSAILVLFLATAPSAPAPAADLAGYMTALDELMARRRRIVDLVLAGRAAEARAETEAPAPAALGTDWTVLPSGNLSWPERELGGTRAEHPKFALWMGFPEIAKPLFDQALRRGEIVPDHMLHAVFRELIVSGQVEAAREWAAVHAGFDAPWAARALADPASFADEVSAQGESRARRALLLWRSRPQSPDGAFFDTLVRFMHPEGRRLALDSAAARPGVTVDEKVQRLRQAARESGKDRAYDAWRRLAEAQLTPYATAEASYRWGFLELARGRPAAAIPLLQQARELDPDLVGSAAQWQLGHAHFEKGDFASALRAWLRGETEFFALPACRRPGDASRHRMWQGVALERLGRVDEAVAHYAAAIGHPLVAARLLDLYESAGQFEDVERIFTEATPRTSYGYAEAVPGLTMLVLRRMARAKDWPSLAAAAASAGDPDHPADDGVQPSRLAPRAIAREARRLLARDCAETVPVIVASLAAVPRHQGAAQLRALGHCGTPPAIEVLSGFAADESPHVAQVARAALAATTLGRKALASRGWPVPSDAGRAREPWSDPPLVFPRANGRPLPSRVIPVAPLAARDDPERRKRLVNRRVFQCPE
jgi:tetratricopeptide (TPR) repeat protein